MARTGGKDRGLFQRKGSTDWWIRWTCPYGHEHQEKAGTKTVARMLYQRRKVAVKTEGYCLTADRAKQKREAESVFSVVATRYLTWSQEHRPRSVRYRCTVMRHLLPVFGAKSLQDITRSDIERYVRQRLQTGVKPATVNRERAILSHLYTMAIRWDLVESSPVRSVETLKEGNESPRPLTLEEERRLLTVLPERYHAIVTLALHTGLRLGELRAQLWRDIDLGSGSLRVSLPKSGKLETIPLNSTAFGLLAGLPQTSDRIFPEMPRKMTDVFIKYARKAGLEDVTFHCLRDTFISRIAPHCAVPTLMALARHRSYAVTRRYLAIDGDHLRQAVEKIVTDEVSLAKP